MKKDKPKAEDFLEKRQWKKFLLSIPLDKSKGYSFKSANDLNTIRVRATQLSGAPECERKFSVWIDFDSKIATITATNK